MLTFVFVIICQKTFLTGLLPFGLFHAQSLMNELFESQINSTTNSYIY